MRRTNGTKAIGTLGATWDGAMVARWSANPLGMLWPESDAAFVTSGGGRRPADRSGGRWSSSLRAEARRMDLLQLSVAQGPAGN
jgi:hypothetical protein